jgi:ankyrin repeat protein
MQVSDTVLWSSDSTADLHNASVAGNHIEVERLLKYEYMLPSSFNIDSADSDGNTALHKAASRGHTTTCRTLCQVAFFLSG